MSQYIVCEMQYARSTRMLHPVGFCSMQASMIFWPFWPTILRAAENTSHTSHVLHELKQSRESANLWQLIDRMTAHLSVRTPVFSQYMTIVLLHKVKWIIECKCELLLQNFMLRLQQKSIGVEVQGAQQTHVPVVCILRATVCTLWG